MIQLPPALSLFRRQPVGWSWLLPALASGLLGCSADSGQQATVALPSGHYEGTVAYQGTELSTVLDLREVRLGQLEADVRFPQDEGLSFSAQNLRYAEPQLLLNQGAAGGVTISAIREGDFLRGVFTLDSIKADFVWVRRGKAEPRAYQVKSLQVKTQPQPLVLLIPQDTAARHPAVALFAEPARQPAAQLRATQLARQGFVAAVVPIPAQAATDSATWQRAAEALHALRQEPTVDTLRVGLWAQGPDAALVPAAVLVQPKAAFVVLESVPITSVEETRPLQVLGRQRIPVLGLYAAADTSLNAKGSARRLRTAVGGRPGTQIRVFPQADARFRLPGQTTADGKWTWPASAPGYLQAIKEWVK